MVSNSLTRFDSITIPCHVNVDDEWHKPMKKFNGLLEIKDDILFPADPRRPEKNHILALRVGEEFETRGWLLNYNTKEATTHYGKEDASRRRLSNHVNKRVRPLVAKEAIVCGCPVVAVDVGDMGEWMEVYPPELRISGAVEAPLRMGKTLFFLKTSN